MAKKDETSAEIINLMDARKAKAKGGGVLNKGGRGNIYGLNVSMGKNNAGTLNIGHIGGNITYKTSAPPRNNVLPSPGTIGANPMLKNRIKELFNSIGEARAKRFPKNAYPTMYRKFKADFGIKKQTWTVIWDWPEGCADEIIGYLEAKFDNTIPGRKRKAAKRPGHLPAMEVLREEEERLLDILDLRKDSPLVKEEMRKSYGISSRRELDRTRYWIWVKHLQSRVDELMDEGE